jgi:hypothetical protein
MAFENHLPLYFSDNPYQGRCNACQGGHILHKRIVQGQPKVSKFRYQADIGMILTLLMGRLE